MYKLKVIPTIKKKKSVSKKEYKFTMVVLHNAKNNMA